MRLGNNLWEPALEVLHQEALKLSVAACQVVPAVLGERIGDVAALCVAMGFRPGTSEPGDGRIQI
jgi:glucokinase